MLLRLSFCAKLIKLCLFYRTKTSLLYCLVQHVKILCQVLKFTIKILETVFNDCIYFMKVHLCGPFALSSLFTKIQPPLQKSNCVFLVALFDVFFQYKLFNIIVNGHNQFYESFHTIILSTYGHILPLSYTLIPLILDNFNFTVFGINFIQHFSLHPVYLLVEYSCVKSHFFYHQYPLVVIEKLIQDLYALSMMRI